MSHVPTIEVFAGEDRTVEEGDEADYSASFTRPAELWDYQYQWDFGDGSPTVTGNPEEGSTRVETTHRFSDYRPAAYTAKLTVSAMSDAGQVSGSDSLSVQVTESEGFTIGAWNAGGTAKSAVRALSAVAWAALTVLIWVGIFSPVILVIAGITYLVNRRGRPALSRLFGLGPRDRRDSSGSPNSSDGLGDPGLCPEPVGRTAEISAVSRVNGSHGQATVDRPPRR